MSSINRICPTLAIAVLLSAGGLHSATYYISTAGRDSWSGTRSEPNAARTDGPFATLAHARDAVRSLKGQRGLTGPVRIVLRGATYRLAETFSLDPRDSGTEACPVTYAAYPGERVVVSGGRRVTRWRPASGGLWVADVPFVQQGGPPFRQLFVNGKRRTLARTPNEGHFRIVGKAAPRIDPKTGKEQDSSKIAFRFDPGDIKPRPNLGDAVVLRNWESGILPLASVNTQTNTVTFTGPLKWAFRPRMRYYIENVAEALDAPGEWYLDREKGLLHYRPLPGEDLAKAEVIAPALEYLVQLEGDAAAGMLVEHVHFEGLSFQHAAYRLEPTGHSDWQAAVTKEAAIQAHGARHCTMKRCEVKHVGGYGIWFERGCSHIRIEQCEVADCGAGGVRFGEQGRREGTLATHHNVLTNSFIHDIGHVFYGAIGVWIGQSSDNEVTHNEICDTNYTGVSVGWSWGFHPTTCHRNKIEHNHIHHIARGVLFDLGAIYTLGISTGTTIRNNLIHHVWAWPEHPGAGGIYPDEGSTGILIENNVVYETMSGGLTVHYGRDNIVRNNVLAFGRDCQIHLGRKDKESSLTFENNIVYYREGALVRRMSTLAANKNLYFCTDGEQPTFPGDLTLEQWQAQGYDKDSTVADPLFVDAENYDFRLRPESPALKLGFEPIDLSEVGLHGDPDWVARPKRIERPAFVMPKKATLPPQLIDDGFEITPLGGNADCAQTHGEAKGASIRVTDELSASGKKCLKFVDAPGLDQSWNPHMYYGPHIHAGLVRLTFDLRFEPGAVIWHEWRDASSPYRVGPSMGVGADGQLQVKNGPTVPLPANEWVRFDITCGMGEQAAGTYDLAVALPGHDPDRFQGLPCDPKCKALTWLGFVSNATDRKVFYLDNVKLELVKP